MISPTHLSFYWNTVIDAGKRFVAKDLFARSAALSYYTVFSLPAMLLVVLKIADIFYDGQSTATYIQNEIGDLIGKQTAEQVITAARSMGVFDSDGWSYLVGIGVLIVSSTTVFITIQAALNKLMEVDSSDEPWWTTFTNRLISFSILLAFGFLLLVSLAVDALITGLGDRLSSLVPELGVVIITLSSLILPLLIIGGLFYLIFKYLPSTKVNNQAAFIGSIITTVLFVAGKFLIGFYIGNSNTASLYDAAGSILVLMVWVYYASVIFLFGASYVSSMHQKLTDRKSEKPQKPAFEKHLNVNF